MQDLEDRTSILEHRVSNLTADLSIIEDSVADLKLNNSVNVLPNIKDVYVLKEGDIIMLQLQSNYPRPVLEQLKSEFDQYNLKVIFLGPTVTPISIEGDDSNDL